ITGWASASTLATTGSSMFVGNRLRTRATRSRTSAAAPSLLRLRRNFTVIWLFSARLIEVITSTPSMPERDSSSGCVIWLSITSALAPRNVVSTETVGSSMLGYSRTERRWNAMRPTSSTTRLITVAKTGRLMVSSEIFIGAGGSTAARRGLLLRRSTRRAAGGEAGQGRRLVVRGLGAGRSGQQAHGGAGPQLGEARAHHHVAGLEAGRD